MKKISKRDRNKTEMRQCYCQRCGYKENKHSVVVANPLGPSLIFCCFHLRCCLLSLERLIYPSPTHPLLLLQQYLCSSSSTDASVIFVHYLGLLSIPRSLRRCLWPSNPSQASSITRPLMMTPSSLLSPQARLTPPTPPLLSSIHLACKHTGSYAIGDVHSDALSLLLPQPTLPLSSSIPQDHLHFPTPPSWLPIPQARNCAATASLVVPNYSPPMLLSPIPWTRRLVLVLCQCLRFCR